MTASHTTTDDARIPDHCGWAARGYWREAYDDAVAALRKVTAERDTAVGNLFITRVERDDAEGHEAETANELRTVRARAEAAEAEVARLKAQAREDAMQLLATSGQAQDALVEVAALRAEVARLKSDRIFILGANHGYDTAMDQVSEEARRYASFYSEGSDGRNTFTLFAEWVDGTSLNGEKT